MRGRHTASGGLRLRIVGFPLMVLAIVALSEISIEPARYPAVTGEHRLQSVSAGAIQRSVPIRLTTTAVGLSWPDQSSGEAAIRVGPDGEDWGPWVPVHTDDHGPDRTAAETSSQTTSDAVYTGGADWIQVQWEGTTVPGLHYVDTTGSTLGPWSRLTAQRERIEWSTDNRLVAEPDRPDILPRSSWGGQDCVEEDVSYSTRTRAEVLIVHHTIHSANANGYSPDQVPDLLYAICSYHVGVRGWNDIGYNTLIDSSGRIWEGRGGGVDLPVRGAHAAGFNSTSVGVAFIGDHNVAPGARIWPSCSPSPRRPSPPRMPSWRTGRGASTWLTSTRSRRPWSSRGTRRRTPMASPSRCGPSPVIVMSEPPGVRGPSATT